jgi:hypothetical protein
MRRGGSPILVWGGEVLHCARLRLGGEVATALNPTRQIDDGDNE